MISADSDMSKQKTASRLSLSIFWLKREGYLPQKDYYSHGGITWSNYYGEIGSLNFIVHLEDSGASSIRLIYTNTNYRTDEKTEMDYQLPIVKTSCHYGGVRYWFVCPLSTNERYCGRRVGVLYSMGKYFGCRHCGDLAYASQKRGGKFRGTSICFPDIDRAWEQVKRTHYNGRMTKKYIRVLKMENRLGAAFGEMAARMERALRHL